jgi:TolB-like protein/DNA-binding winged helix-turn-helix (wHTH) protein/Tfp pilus assembly protein PilF
VESESELCGFAELALFILLCALCMKTSSRNASFGPYSLDLRSGELRKLGTRVRIGEQAFRILCMLLETPGEMVTREELRMQLWPGDTFVDFDHGLNSAVQRLRDCLSDSAGNPRWIETIPRRGYRFVGRVDWLENNSSSNSLIPSRAIESEPESPNGGTRASGLAEPKVCPQPIVERDRCRAEATLPNHGKQRWLLILVVIAASALLVFLSLNRLRERWLGRPRTYPIKSLAVLPLVNLSNDPDQDYFADGITEELTTDLAKISALRVISRTSTARYKGSRKGLPEIARELNVDAIVEGTVTRSASHLRITANLVQASPEKHLWAESYASEVGDVVTLQGLVAQAIAREIQVSLTKNEQDLLTASRPVNPDAQDLYYMGMFSLRKGTAESSQKAISYLQQAIQKDPNYAQAYAGLAATYANWIPGLNRPRDRMPEAREYAMKALARDNTLADAHSVLGTVKLLYEWDWPGAEEEFRQTMRFNPNYAWAHCWYSRGLVIQGRKEEAIAEANLSLAIDPSPLGWDYLVWIFLLAGRDDIASERAHKLLDLAPNYSWAHWTSAKVLEQQGKMEEAAQEFLKADELFGAGPQEVARLKEMMASSGAAGYWRQKLLDYKKASRSGYAPPVLAAEACVRVGDRECALEWLELGYRERDDLMINLEIEPIFFGLRSDPRFQSLVRRVGISAVNLKSD